MEQISQSDIGVNMNVTDTQCVAMYQATVTLDGNQVSSEQRSSPSIIIGDLDVCQNSYSVAGRTITAGGVLSNRSSSVSLTPDLSGNF